ncbi:hypothetical protein AAFF_G00173320 [Aldrovandia affinis]|uniref:Thymopoietin n=1 Tax=Aldrovandia affinis TaxID=143900 RepID=A0AAD7WVQ0_9TELE|nr:hypothetical protein AAFF_G00173320 [Aldrovandia affinis]
MSEFLEDPSILTKEKLKSELLAHNVALPSGEQRKDVYVQLYLDTLTVQNREKDRVTDTFSSDEDLDLPPPVVANKSRSGRKATRKTDKPRQTDDVDVTDLSDESLKEQLEKYGVNAGPVVASTRELYETKLQKLSEQGSPGPPSTTLKTKVNSNQNGNTDSDQYSDKEEEERAEPEPEPEAEAVPLVERPVRSRGRTARHPDQSPVEERLMEGGQTSSMNGKDVLNEMFPTSPTGISATCRRPIRGAAGRPVKESDFWLDESLLCRRELTERSYSYNESRAGQLSSFSLATAPPGGRTRERHFLPVWLQLLFLCAVAGLLFYIYQAMEANELNPFGRRPLSPAATPGSP